MIENPRDPTDKEILELIASADPFSSDFAEKIFENARKTTQSNYAILNILYEVLQQLEDNAPQSLIWMVEGFEQGCECEERGNY